MIDEDGNDFSEAFARKFALPLVTYRFPNCPDWLQRKLADGVVVRRKRFLFRQHHQRKLALNVDNKHHHRHPSMQTSSVLVESTIRTLNTRDREPPPPQASLGETQQYRPTLSRTSASRPPPVLPLNKASQDEQSNRSTVFTAALSSSIPVDIPQPPRMAPGTKEFECPYCCLVLPSKETKSAHWRYVMPLQGFLFRLQHIYPLEEYSLLPSPCHLTSPVGYSNR
jgi:hypothetical protein